MLTPVSNSGVIVPQRALLTLSGPTKVELPCIYLQFMLTDSHAFYKSTKTQRHRSYLEVVHSPVNIKACS